jgi:hypothetical protein
MIQGKSEVLVSFPPQTRCEDMSQCLFAEVVDTKTRLRGNILGFEHISETPAMVGFSYAYPACDFSLCVGRDQL